MQTINSSNYKITQCLWAQSMYKLQWLSLSHPRDFPPSRHGHNLCTWSKYGGGGRRWRFSSPTQDKHMRLGRRDVHVHCAFRKLFLATICCQQPLCGVQPHSGCWQHSAHKHFAESRFPVTSQDVSVCPHNACPLTLLYECLALHYCFRHREYGSWNGGGGGGVFG